MSSWRCLVDHYLPVDRRETCIGKVVYIYMYIAIYIDVHIPVCMCMYVGEGRGRENSHLYWNFLKCALHTKNGQWLFIYSVHLIAFGELLLCCAEFESGRKPLWKNSGDHVKNILEPPFLATPAAPPARPVCPWAEIVLHLLPPSHSAALALVPATISPWTSQQPPHCFPCFFWTLLSSRSLYTAARGSSKM